ncbi:MAG: efflux RND transporter periplasmic adaptor subunit [Planctomycetota bacterium]
MPQSEKDTREDVAGGQAPSADPPAPRGVDLGRLKIPDGEGPAAGRKWLVPAVGAGCLVAGLVFGRLFAPSGAGAGGEVTTAVAKPSASSGGGGFTAGGWVEVATPRFPVSVTSRVSERLTELAVKEGDTVEAGQVLARLYDADIRSRLALAEARRDSARRELDKLKAGFRDEDVAAARAREAGAAELARIAQANYRRAASLARGAVSEQELDELRSRLTTAQAAHDLAKAELGKMEAGSRREDVAVAEAKLREAEAAAELAERQLAYTTVRAPDCGKPLRVLAVLRNVGDWVEVGKAAEVLSLYDPARMQVRVDVKQDRIKSVRVGGKATVTTDADRARTYRGTVLRVEPLAVLAKNTITVRVGIEDPDAFLFPEMVAQVSFLAGDRVPGKGGLLVPAEAVLTDAAGRYVLVDDGGRAASRRVEVLSSSGETAIVTGELRSGERVVVKGALSLRAGDAIGEAQ